MQINYNGREEVHLRADEDDSRAVKSIVTELAPVWLELFSQKNKDYGPEAADALGVKGQFADLNRKMLKLKRAVWDGERLRFENEQEVISDLIGHLFLMWDMLAREERAERASVYGYGEGDAMEFVPEGFGESVAAEPIIDESLGIDGIADMLRSMHDKISRIEHRLEQR